MTVFILTYIPINSSECAPESRLTKEEEPPERGVREESGGGYMLAQLKVIPYPGKGLRSYNITL